MSLGMKTAEQMLELQRRTATGRMTAQEVVDQAELFAKNDRSLFVIPSKLMPEVVAELRRWGFDVLIDEDGTTVDWSAGKGLNLVPPRKSKKSDASAGKAKASRSAGQTTAG